MENIERDEIERDAKGANMDEAKELYEEIYANVSEADRPSFTEWLEEANNKYRE